MFWNQRLACALVRGRVCSIAVSGQRRTVSVRAPRAIDTRSRRHFGLLSITISGAGPCTTSSGIFDQELPAAPRFCDHLRKHFMRRATATTATTIKRCSWVRVDDPLMLQYHDREWGVPVHDDRRHFEFLVLEGAQAGLSWAIVLKKREGYRRAFQGFDPEKVARFSVRRIEKLVLNAEIIRNRMKIEAAVRNARAFLKIQEEFGSFDSYCWRFVDGRPKLNRWKIMGQIPATSVESDAFSKDLKHRA